MLYVFINFYYSFVNDKTYNALLASDTFQVWKGLMRAVEWNKKEELGADQALRHLKVDKYEYGILNNACHAC